jgi:acetoin utilization deacetylase AcuC-like enzyme
MLLFTHAKCLEHEMTPGHPERPDRLRAVLEHLEATGLMSELEVREPAAADTATLAQIHRLDYLQTLTQLAPERGLVALDPDTAIGPSSLTAAALAAGAVADAVQALLKGEARRAFCAVRPPGHHAEAGGAMGFCLYNNVALGAVTALADPGVTRVAVLDFDVHHGNGTVDIFKDRPEVLVCSSFQHPFYPHRYTDIDRGNIINTPLPAGTSGATFRAAIQRDWLPALERHRPQLILVSAGFDAHRLDPLAQLELEEADFRWITELIVDQAEAYAGGRVVSTLEGGYDLVALAQSATAHTAALMGN